MKKVFTLAMVAACSLSASATVDIQSVNELSRNAHVALKSVTLEKGTAVAGIARAAADGSSAAPETLVGKSYVTVYQDSEEKYNNFFEVEAKGDSIVLVGFAEGYNVTAAYNADMGTVTIPTGKVIGTHSTYGDITIHALDAAQQKYVDTDIVGTVSGNTITFNYGVYGTVVYQGQPGGLIWMQDITAVEANAEMSFTLGGQNYSCPLLVNKTADNTIKVIGMNTLFTGGYFYNVPVTFDASTKVATLKSDQPIGYSLATNGTGAKNIYYMLAQGSSGLTLDPTLGIVTTGSSSTLTANTNMFLGYDTNGAGSYRGYSMSNFKIMVDYDILTQAATEDPFSDPTSVEESGVNYELDLDAMTAEVVGCLGNVKYVNIASSVVSNGKTYTVTSVADKAFYSNRIITAVHIPASIKVVGTDAFRNVSNLHDLYIDDMAAWCGIDFANGNANPIYNVFPTSTSKWGNVYVNNQAVTEVVVPEGVTVLKRTFYGFKAMTSISLPSTLKTLGDQTFTNCSGLTAVDIPASVDSIGSAFYSCANIKELVIPEGVVNLNSMAFSGCKSLETVTLPSTLKTVGVMSFYNCSSLSKITSLSVVPPYCRMGDEFDDCSTATLYVPVQAVDAYKAAAGWSVFTNVEGIGGTTGVDSIETETVDMPSEYFNLQGVKVAPENMVPGIYVVRKGSKVAKVYVK